MNEVTEHSSVPATDDSSDTLEGALARASAGLNRAAVDMGAVEVHILLANGPGVEVTYFWSVSGSIPSNAADLTPLRALRGVAGAFAAGTAVAGLLRAALSGACQSFLLYTWPVGRRTVSVIFGFRAPDPHYEAVPEAVLEGLNLIGLATWSVKEVVRLRSELKTVNDRLAGRKLVERAKGLLQSQRGLTEEHAYEFLRSVSRRRRITLAQTAAEILRSNGTAFQDRDRQGVVLQ